MGPSLIVKFEVSTVEMLQSTKTASFQSASSRLLVWRDRVEKVAE